MQGPLQAAHHALAQLQAFIGSNNPMAAVASSMAGHNVVAAGGATSGGGVGSAVSAGGEDLHSLNPGPQLVAAMVGNARSLQAFTVEVSERVCAFTAEGRECVCLLALVMAGAKSRAPRALRPSGCILLQTHLLLLLPGKGMPGLVLKPQILSHA
eukprot:526640-Pelagomonas_calceolata.AAC.3